MSYFQSLPLDNGWYEIPGPHLYVPEDYYYQRLMLYVAGGKVISAFGATNSTVPYVYTPDDSFLNGWRASFPTISLEDLLATHLKLDIDNSTEWDEDFL